MIIPVSTALTFERLPVVTISTLLLCIFVFLLQIVPGVTEQLMYYPDSWNPITMITSSLAHGDLGHIFWNMVFYIAFAPALEIILKNKLRYVWIMLIIAFVVGICDSIAILITGAEPIPSLGFSGVVTGMIGLSAFLIPHARIRTYYLYGYFWKKFYVPSWILAIFYIGGDLIFMFTLNDYGGIDLLAHVSGGFAGYLYGYYWLKERKMELREELAFEYDVAKVERRKGVREAEEYRARKEAEEQIRNRKIEKANRKFVADLYGFVTAKKNSRAVTHMITRYNLETPTSELEKLFRHMEDWDPTRTFLCLGRLIIQKLDQEKKDGKAIVYIAKCQKISPRFVLPDITRVPHFAQLAIETHRFDVAKNLLIEAKERYGEAVNIEEYERLARLMEHS